MLWTFSTCDLMLSVFLQCTDKGFNTRNRSFSFYNIAVCLEINKLHKQKLITVISDLTVDKIENKPRNFYRYFVNFV